MWLLERLLILFMPRKYYYIVYNTYTYTPVTKLFFIRVVLLKYNICPIDVLSLIFDSL